MKATSTPHLEAMRHSLAHVMAQAVLQMFPEAGLAIGPPIENGFYYDFDLPRTLIPEDLPLIEEKMRQIQKEHQVFAHYNKPINESIEFLRKINQPYKVEMAEDLKKKGETELSFYENKLPDGTPKFVDMCAGPHIEDTGQTGAFRLTSVAGAYWRGNEKNKMLQRIYGLAFATQPELDDHLKMLEEAKKRDHRKLGKELNIFTFDDDVGPGLPLWLPNGAVLIEELETLAKDMEQQAGYFRVKSPHIAKESMYLKSGHLPYYQDSMFPPLELDGTKYYLKAMNCPHHHKIFAAMPRSYRDLPLRLAEYGTCYRFEQTGELFGLMRVRSLQMNDAHIYCTKEQFEKEFQAVNQLYLNYFKIFGIEKYVMRFSTHDPKELNKKYVNEPELWIETEKMVRRVLKKNKIPYVEVANEAAFYGPKIDVQVWSAIGREFTLATNQVDFAVPKRFDLTYINEKGQPETPLCIHRAPLGTHERFIGFLIEHYAGAFPTWLAPMQIALIPVSDQFIKFTQKLAKIFRKKGLRVDIDQAAESVGKKIRAAELKKIPYMIVIGEKEAGSDMLSVRSFKTKQQEQFKVKEFIKKVKKEVEDRQ